MRKPIVVLWAALAFFAVAGGPAAAGDLSVNAGGLFVPFLSGDAGSGSDVPAYDDVFDEGWGMNLEVAYRVHDRFSLLAGFGYEAYSGGNYQGVAFDDRTIIPLFVGAKYHFTGKDARWNPYLRADFGMARLESVDVSYLGSSAEYWESSWEFLGAIGAGLEYRLDPIGFFVEIKARYLESPDDALGYFSEADSAWSLPVVIGICWHF